MRAVTKHRTGTRDEWLAARLELLEAEKELTRRSDELARQRQQELPWVRIDKEYRLETDEGSASLADLFRGRSQLLVYHFMFGPDYTAGCPSCSAIADENGRLYEALAEQNRLLESSFAIHRTLTEAALTGAGRAHICTELARLLGTEIVLEQVEWQLQGDLLSELLDAGTPLAPSLIARARRHGVDLAHGRRIVAIRCADLVADDLLALVRRATGRSLVHRDASLVCLRGEHVVLA